MKWIGQHIVDLIARFRSDVYLDNPSAGDTDPDKFLALDSNKKIVYRTGAEVLSDIGAGDITGVDLTGGTGIAIASETGTTSGDYSATINCDLEGTELKSTGESGGSKFLREDGDGTCSWQTISSGGISHDGSTANGVLTFKDADEATVESNLTFDGSTLTLTGDMSVTGDTFTFQSGNADDPQFVIKNTTADNQGARFQLRKDRGASMVDGDRIGEVDFIGEDASQNVQQYGKIFVQAVETTHGQETGKMRLQVAQYDGIQIDGLVLTGQDADDEIDVEIATGAASTTTIAGTLTMGSTATLNNSGQIQTASHPNINTLAGLQSAGTAGSDLTIAGTTFFTGDTPVVTVHSTNTTPASSGELQFKKDAADTEDGENLGKITFYGEDEGDNNTQFAQIHAEISESDETDEAGKLVLSVAESDGTNTAITAGLVLEGEHATDGQVDVTIGAGALSTTTIAGVLRPKGQIQIVTCNFKDDCRTSGTWIPLGSPPEEKITTNFTNEQSTMIMPCSGYLKEIIVKANYGTYTNENINIGFYEREANKKMNGQGQVGSDIVMVTPTQDNSDNDNNTRSTGDLGTTYPYSKHSAVGIKMTWQDTGPLVGTDKTYVTVVFEHDLTSLSY